MVKLQEDEFKRADRFKGNESLDGLLKELKQLFLPLQKQKEDEFESNKWPIGFIVGTPRSGTTLFLQWISSLNAFSFPTNFLNRFAYAPYIGALLQQMIFNNVYDLHDEFIDSNNKIAFVSELGKTEGILSPCEFQHFFRNYMGNLFPGYLDANEIKKVDFLGLRKGLASIESVFRKPFITKAIMLQYNVLDLFDAIPNSIFFYIKREPVYAMQSILLARKKYYNDENVWWSVRPREYESIKEMDVYYQIAGQVFFSNRSIEVGLEELPNQKKMIIQYEHFVDNPEIYFHAIKDFYDALGLDVGSNYQSFDKFESKNEKRISDLEFDKLSAAYQHFETIERNKNEK